MKKPPPGGIVGLLIAAVLGLSLVAVFTHTGKDGSSTSLTVTVGAPASIHIPASPVAAAKFAAVACAGADQGGGRMGECNPAAVSVPGTGEFFRSLRAASASVNGITFPDLSNNDPASDSQIVAIAQHHQLIINKANQGTGFIDRTFLPMTLSARRHGMATGGYDFVSCYCVAEAKVFSDRLAAAGMTRTSTRWAPPTLDIEYGSATRTGVQAMVNYLIARWGRVNIYTGGWYWTPHLGCWWPKGAVPAWLAGYPSAPVFCGLPPSLYTQHQYTDAGWNGAFNSDMTVWLRPPAAFDRFINAKPVPTASQVRARRHARLARLYRERAQLRHLRAARCPLPTIHSHKCTVWDRHEGLVDAAIAREQHAAVAHKPVPASLKAQCAALNRYRHARRRAVRAGSRLPAQERRVNVARRKLLERHYVSCSRSGAVRV